MSAWTVTWIWELKWRQRLRPRFGLLWDRNGNPYCPRCRELLSLRFARTIPGTLALRDSMICPGCQAVYCPSPEGGRPAPPLSFNEARKLL